MQNGSATPTTLDRLGDEIAQLAGHITAAMARWLGLIADFDAGEGWRESGCKSMAHWLSWRCGVSLHTAREYVRVARRLRALPLVREAFARGRLSYSKARALTRLEAVARERELLEFALAATASQLERTVRAYRASVSMNEDPGRAHAERAMAWRFEDSGSVTFEGRLAADDAALLIAVLESVRDRLDKERAIPKDAGATSGSDASRPEPIAARRADALMALALDRAAHEHQTSTGAERCEVIVHVDAEALTSQNAPQGAHAETDTGLPLGREAVRRLCCDAGVVTLAERDGQALSIGRRRRTIPPAIRRALRDPAPSHDSDTTITGAA